MANFGNALGGAATGAGLGSAFGPVGAGIGGLLGGVGSLLGFGKSKKDKIKQRPQYTPQQEQLINQILQMTGPNNQLAMNYLQQLLSEDPEALEDFERPYLEAYERQTIPQIAERFSALGGQSNSAFNQAMAQGGKDLQTQLASLRSGLKGQAVGQLGAFNQVGLSQLNQPYLQQGSPGFFQSIAPAAGNIFGNIANNAAGRYWGF